MTENKGLTAEQKENRKSFIGASDIYSLVRQYCQEELIELSKEAVDVFLIVKNTSEQFAIDPKEKSFKTCFETLADKKNINVKDELNFHLSFGSQMEDEVRKYCSQRFIVSNDKKFVDTGKKWIGYSPDGYVFDNYNSGKKGVLEVKTMSNWGAKSSLMPTKYYMQVQYQMFCSGLEYGLLLTCKFDQNFRDDIYSEDQIKAILHETIIDKDKAIKNGDNHLANVLNYKIIELLTKFQIEVLVIDRDNRLTSIFEKAIDCFDRDFLGKFAMINRSALIEDHNIDNFLIEFTDYIKEYDDAEKVKASKLLRFMQQSGQLDGVDRVNDNNLIDKLNRFVMVKKEAKKYAEEEELLANQIKFYAINKFYNILEWEGKTMQIRVDKRGFVSLKLKSEI